MGGRSRRASSPLAPAILPQIVREEDSPVPPYFLDETGYYSAGIEPSPPVTSRETTMRRDEALSSSSDGKLRKLVRFLDRVEDIPASPFYHAEEEQGAKENKKMKFAPTTSLLSRRTSYKKEKPAPLDIGISSGLGRAGSPNRSPTRSPNHSSKNLHQANVYLAPPTDERAYLYKPPSPPPSWRIPPENLLGHQPHVQPPPRVRSPNHPGEEIDLMVRDSSRDSGIYMDYSSEDEANISDNSEGRGFNSPPSSPRLMQNAADSPHPPPIYPVISRKMWHGDVRYEDQWGRRLIPIEHRDSFKFDLWPVEEDVDAEGSEKKGAWVGRSRGLRRG